MCVRRRRAAAAGVVNAAPRGCMRQAGWCSRASQRSRGLALQAAAAQSGRPAGGAAPDRPGMAWSRGSALQAASLEPDGSCASSRCGSTRQAGRRSRASQRSRGLALQAAAERPSCWRRGARQAGNGVEPRVRPTGRVPGAGRQLRLQPIIRRHERGAAERRPRASRRPFAPASGQAVHAWPRGSTFALGRRLCPADRFYGDTRHAPRRRSRDVLDSLVRSDTDAGQYGSHTAPAHSSILTRAGAEVPASHITPTN